MSREESTVLYIYDRLNVRVARKALLEQNGYHILEATNGHQALFLLASHRVDAVIVDHQMPGTDTHAVVAQLRQINSQVPIVLLSTGESLSDTRTQLVDKLFSDSQTPQLFLSNLQELLNGQARPFFYRWLDIWKERNHGARQ